MIAGVPSEPTTRHRPRGAGGLSLLTLLLLLWPPITSAALHQSTQPVDLNPLGHGPVYATFGEDTLRYVNISCPDCYKIEKFDRVLSVEVLVEQGPGRFVGIGYLLKDQGLKENLELIAPIDPCTRQLLKISVRFRDNNEIVQEKHVFGKYNGECCTTENIHEPILEQRTSYIFVVNAIGLAFVIFVMVGAVFWLRCRIKDKTPTHDFDQTRSFVE